MVSCQVKEIMMNLQDAHPSHWPYPQMLYLDENIFSRKRSSLLGLEEN